MVYLPELLGVRINQVKLDILESLAVHISVAMINTIRYNQETEASDDGGLRYIDFILI